VPKPTPALSVPPIHELEATDATPLASAALENETVPRAIDAVLPVAPLRPTTPAETFDITVPEVMAQLEPLSPAVPETEAPGPDHWSVAVTPTYTPTFQSVIEEIPPAEDVVSTIPEQPASYSSEPPTMRPVTSEMVAIDAFEAFETVWDATPPQVEPSMPDEPVAAAPIDDNSLGTGIDAQHVWGDEITRDTGDYQAVSNPLDTLAVDPGQAQAIEPGWASHTTPELPMPAWLADDSPAGDTAVREELPAASLPDELPPASHEATANSIVGSVRSQMPWSDPRVAAYAAFVTSPDGVPTIANAKPGRGVQVSAALERLAARIRDGEIDVSSVAPEAPDAAMLASVLAALLGGSTSR
jgi:hypothetical protein